jgi:hypothetical protein
MISLRLLTSINFDHCDDCRLRTIHQLMDELQDGVIAATVNGDAIESLHLTEYGESLLPPPTLPELPTATA